MTKIYLKNMPKLRLGDLLRRRKMALRQFLDEHGLTTYEGLVIRCDKLGVQPPDETEFKAACPASPVNNPTEGVVVLEPPPVIDGNTGRTIESSHDDVVTPVVDTLEGLTQEDPLTEGNSVLPAEPTETSQKKFRKKERATKGD